MSEDLIDDPTKLIWHYGEVPKVKDVFYDCLIFFWGPVQDDFHIGLIRPHGDWLNPLRWCDGSMPCWGFDQPKGWWAWVKTGSKPIPEEISLSFREQFARDTQARIDSGEWPPEAMDRFLENFPNESKK
jgi:hypothetical protein